jgi:hypothetical protein
LSPERISFRFENLRNVVNAGRGRRCLSVYIREQAEKWLRWDKEDGLLPANAVSGAGKAPRIDFPPELVKTVAGWVPSPPSIAYAAEVGVNIVEQYSRFVRSREPEKFGLFPGRELQGARHQVERAFRRTLQHVAAKLPRAASDGAAA